MPLLNSNTARNRPRRSFVTRDTSPSHILLPPIRRVSEVRRVLHHPSCLGHPHDTRSIHIRFQCHVLRLWIPPWRRQHPWRIHPKCIRNQMLKRRCRRDARCERYAIVEVPQLPEIRTRKTSRRPLYLADKPGEGGMTIHRAVLA